MSLEQDISDLSKHIHTIAKEHGVSVEEVARIVREIRQARPWQNPFQSVFDAGGQLDHHRKERALNALLDTLIAEDKREDA